jgi:ABC-type glycerol-3-phosphate transport system permease component
MPLRESQVAHLINSYCALIIPHVPAPIAAFIFKKFFDGVPISLEQAAEVDGAGWWTAYRRIALQMASAVLGALPLVFVFLLAQRQIVEGVAGTALKSPACAISLFVSCTRFIRNCT